MEIHTSNNQDEQRPLTPESATPSSSVPDGLGLHFWLAFWAIAITNLAAALDATTLSIALPVSTRYLFSIDNNTNNQTRPSRSLLVVVRSRPFGREHHIFWLAQPRCFFGFR